MFHTFFVVCNQVFRLCEFNLAQFALMNRPSLPSQNPLLIVRHDQRMLVILVAILVELQVWSVCQQYVEHVRRDDQLVIVRFSLETVGHFAARAHQLLRVGLQFTLTHAKDIFVDIPLPYFVEFVGFFQIFCFDWKG